MPGEHRVLLSTTAAPVGDKPAHSKEGDGEEDRKVRLFPHIYGPINFDAVVAELSVDRSENGTFLSIEGLA